MWPSMLGFAGVWFRGSTFAPPRLRSANDGARFLSSIWQVEAVALALSAAVIIFGLQSFLSSRHSSAPGSQRDFAIDSGLFGVLGIGIAGLLLPAFVLAGYGSGAPGGWAATWASVICCLGLIAIPIAFVLTMRSVRPRRLDDQRNRRLRTIVERTVERELLERVAVHLARELCESSGMQYLGYSLSSVRDGLELVPAPSSGVIKDIRLRELFDISIATSGDPRASLMVRIGQGVHEGAPVAAAAINESIKERHRRRVVKVRPVPDADDLLANHLTSLHEEASNAIREERVEAYDRAVEAYANLLLAAPRAWGRYGARFTGALATGIGPFEPGWIRIIHARLFEELNEAIRADSDALVRSWTSLAHRTVRDAVPLGASALVIETLNLLASAYGFAAGLERTRASQEAIHACRGTMFELLRFVIIPSVERSSGDELEWAEARELLVGAMESVASLVKSATSAGAQEMAEVESLWSDLFGQWRPDLVWPSEALINAQAAQLGEEDPVVVEGRAAVARRRREAELLEELRTRRETFRFELAAWVARGMRFRGADEDGVAILKELAGSFPSPNAVLDAAARAGEAVLLSSGAHLQQWIWEDVSTGGVGHGARPVPSSEPDVVACAALLLLRCSSPTSDVSSFVANEWTELNIGPLRDAVDAAYRDPTLPDAIGLDHLDERVEALWDALTEAVERRRVRQLRAIAEAPVDPEIVDAFEAAVRSSWRGNRIAPALFWAEGALSTTHDKPPDDACRFHLTLDCDKRSFQPDDPVANPDYMPAEAGRRAAILEMNETLSALLTDAKEYEADGPARADAVRQILGAMREDGYEPTLLIMSYDWRLLEQLGLSLDAPVTIPFSLPEEWHHLYRGSFDRCTVLTWPGLEGRAMAIDVERFAHWRQYLEPNGCTLRVRFEFFDEHESLSMAEGDALKALVIRSKARMHVQSFSEICVLDAAAARKMKLPAAP